MRTSFFSPLLAAVFLCVTGCHSSSKASEQATADPNVQVYHLRGKVVSTDASSGTVMIDGEAIPGYMEAMTMPYQLKDPNVLSELHPGDTITADVLVSKSAQQTVQLDHIVVVAQAKPDYKPTAVYHVPAPGAQTPDFTLRNQDGREIHFHQFRGKELLITFIYTHCPLPNFCPLMSRNFAAISRDLKADPALYAKTHLLSVSFDPKRDTPTQLRAYGASYVGGSSPEAFKHWDFAVPSETELKKMALYFDVGVTYGPDDTISHTLSTTLIGPDGKVAQFYPSNQWTPAQVENDIKRLAASAG
jgi:protein SCO1/2